MAPGTIGRKRRHGPVRRARVRGREGWSIWHNVLTQERFSEKSRGRVNPPGTLNAPLSPPVPPAPTCRLPQMSHWPILVHVGGGVHPRGTLNATPAPPGAPLPLPEVASRRALRVRDDAATTAPLAAASEGVEGARAPLGCPRSGRESAMHAAPAVAGSSARIVPHGGRFTRRPSPRAAPGPTRRARRRSHLPLAPALLVHGGRPEEHVGRGAREPGVAVRRPSADVEVPNGPHHRPRAGRHRYPMARARARLSDWWTRVIRRPPPGRSPVRSGTPGGRTPGLTPALLPAVWSGPPP